MVSVEVLITTQEFLLSLSKPLSTNVIPYLDMIKYG